LASVTNDLTPPVAKRVPHARTFHGDTVVDEYAWMAAALEDPDAIDYLKAENLYADERTAHLAGLREKLFGEIKQRTQETDLSLPTRKGAFWYFTRTTEGLQYGVQCRIRATSAEPPAVEPGKPLDGEEILLDGNALAEGHEFFELGTFDISPDGNWLAYSVDFEGDERYVVHFKDLRTGDVLDETIEDTGYGTAWSLDASAFFYSTMDDAWRSDKIWRHIVGEPPADDVIVVQEDDEHFSLGVALTRSERFIMVSSSSKITSEYAFIPSDRPTAALEIVAPRRDGVEYHVEHHGDRFLILHNDDAEDFALASAPVSSPGDWTPLIAHEPGRRLTDIDAFESHLVLSLRSEGLTALRVIPVDGSPSFDITFPEPIYTVGMESNEEFATSSIRIGYTSMVTPGSIYACDLTTGALTLLKRKAVLADAQGHEFSPDDYEQFRVWATAPDGVRVPISIVARRGVPKGAPLVLYGYGSYELSVDPYFSVARLSLLDRGVVFAIAHIRGGGEMGRNWYDQGKLLAKKNTFTDFIACARHVVETGWTTVDKLVARGGSAGGLLVGAATNMAPDAFGGVVAEVPFVDALTTILDPSLPLTVMEWDEWGNPVADPEVYAYMKSYTPYENVTDVTYPAQLVMTSLNDTRVLYTEPAKWVARMRATSPRTDIVMKTEMGAGHAGPSGRYDSWHEEAFVLAWILDLFKLAE
jgi:oligopeptidase B